MVYCFHWINVRFFWTCICKNCLVFIPWKIKTSDNILHIQSAQCQFKRNQYSIMGQFRKFLRQSIIFSVFTDCVASCQMRLRKPEGRVLPYKRLMGMCRWMGSHFHDWIDYNGVAFSIEFLEWGRTFLFLGWDSSSYLRLANVPECSYCRWKVECSSFNLKIQFIKIESN